MSTSPTELTLLQKLNALSARYYQGTVWEPKAGDFYTTCRADLELYRIAKIEDGVVFTEYCTRPGIYADWPEEEFTSVGFGPKRVWVPNWIFEHVK